MVSRSHNNEADIIEAFSSTSRHLDVSLNIDNDYFDQMLDNSYPKELQLNKAIACYWSIQFTFLIL